MTSNQNIILGNFNKLLKKFINVGYHWDIFHLSVPQVELNPTYCSKNSSDNFQYSLLSCKSYFLIVYNFTKKCLIPIYVQISTNSNHINHKIHKHISSTKEQVPII